MKQKLFLSLILSLLLCGCSLFEGEKDPLKDFEHYNLDDDKEKIYYQYVDSNHNYQTYRLAEIPSNLEQKVYGLFLQLEGNDYILLDKIEICSKPNYRFYENKLYITSRCNNYYEFILDGIDTQKNDLSNKFDYKFTLGKITNVNDDYIDFNGNGPWWRHEDKSYETVKCSLKNYQCEVIDN